MPESVGSVGGVVVASKVCAISFNNASTLSSVTPRIPNKVNSSSLMETLLLIDGSKLVNAATA